MIHPIRIRFVKLVVVLTSCGLSGQLWAQSITVVSWGGSYARASQEAYHKPFTAETGIEVQLEDYNGGLAQIRAQVEAGAVYWDVVDLELADGEVVMTTAYNGRIFNAQVLEDQPFVIVWDGQVLDAGQLGIVAGTPRLDAALQFVEFASRPSSMAGIGRYIAYSPARRSADALISTHAESGVGMRPHMPNTPENTQRALRSDWAWWSDNGDEMNERFIVWLSQ